MNLAQHAVLGFPRREGSSPSGATEVAIVLTGLGTLRTQHTQHCVLGYDQTPLRGKRSPESHRLEACATICRHPQGADATEGGRYRSSSSSSSSSSIWAAVTAVRSRIRLRCFVIRSR